MKRQKFLTPLYQLAHPSTPSCSAAMHDLTDPVANQQLTTSINRECKTFFFPLTLIQMKTTRFSEGVLGVLGFVLVSSNDCSYNFFISVSYYLLCEKAGKNRHPADLKTCGSCTGCRCKPPLETQQTKTGSLGT